MRYFRAFFVYMWAISLMIIGLPVLIWSKYKRKNAFSLAMDSLHHLVNFVASGVLTLAGIKLEIEGKENIPETGSVLFVGNHQSLIDIPILLKTIPRATGFIAKQELSRIPLLSLWIKGIESIYIYRGESRKALEAIISAATLLKQKEYALVVFPEGTRSKDGNVGEFKAGSMKIALRSRCEIVPFAIKGSMNAMPHDKYTFNPGTVHLTFFPPLSIEQMSTMDTIQIAEHCRREITTQLSVHEGGH